MGNRKKRGLMRTAGLPVIVLVVSLLLTSVYHVSPTEAKDVTQTSPEVYHHEDLTDTSSASIEIANLSCHELSALGSAISKVLDEERKQGNIRKIATARAQELAGAAEDVGGLFSGPIGFFRKHLSSLGWIEVEPPENVITLPIESEEVIVGIDAMANLVLMIFGGTLGELGGSIISILTPLAKWGGKELATKGELGDIGYFRVTKPVYGTMDVIYSKETKEACVNIALEDLEEKWKEEYGWEDERIYMYIPFDEEPPKLKKTDGEFDYTVAFKAEALTRFEAGAIVKVTNTGDSGLNVRDAPAGTVVKTVPDGWKFKVIGGPLPALLEGKVYTWWKVKEETYESFPGEGWIAEDFIEAVDIQTLVPETPSDPSIIAKERIERAINWASLQEGKADWTGYCLGFVVEAFGRETDGLESPEDAKKGLGDRFYPVANNWNPPPGALIFFSASGNWCDAPYGCIDLASFGHIGIYLGNGEVIHAFGKVSKQKITEIVPLHGKDSQGNEYEVGSYIGWAYPPVEGISGPAPVPPTTTITGGPSGTIDTDSATLTWSGNDDKTPTSNLVYSYYLRGYDSNWSTFTSATSRSYSGLANGNYNFYVVARDQAGNVDPTPASRSFTVRVTVDDTVPPTTTITGGPSGTIDTDSATFTWSGNDDKTPTSNLVYSYYLEGYDSNWSTFTSATSRSYPGLANGNYNFYVVARDQAGNVDPSSASRSFTVRVTVDDTVPPTTTITGGPSGTIETDNATFTWSGNDDKTSTSSLVYSYYLEGYDSNWSTFTSATSRSYSGLANGNYNFYVEARDQAGNVDPTPASRSFTVNVTGTAPTEPYLVDVGVSSETEPWPPRTFVQATPGDRINTWYNIGYYGPRISIRLRTAIVDPDGKQIPNQLGDSFLVLMEDTPLHTGWIGETFEIPADAVPAVYDVAFSIWSEDGVQEYDSMLKLDWLGLNLTE